MIPDRTKTELLKGTYNMSSGGDTFRVALLKESTEYSPDSSAHEFVDDVLDGGTTGAEMDDTNYARQTLANQTVTEDNTDNEGVWDADDVTFTNLGGSQDLEAILIYRQIGGDDTSPADDDIMRIIDDSEDSSVNVSTNGDDLNVVWAAEGIINLG